MSKQEIRVQAIQSLLAAAAEGTSVFNVDYKRMKELASSAYEASVSEKIRQPFFNAGKYEGRTEAERNIENAISYGIHGFPSAKLLKLVEKANETPMVSAVIELITEWQPVRDAIKTIKPNVVMGRKPSTNPRLTPERTLENTGTCSNPGCNMNVKLDQGQHIVAHGYTVQWGFQSGNCFGVGYKPIEISPEGLVAVKAANEKGLARLTEMLAELEAGPETLSINKKVSFAWNAPTKDFTYEKGSFDYNELLARRLRETKQHMRGCTQNIENCTTAIATWEAKPLPDAK